MSYVQLETFNEILYQTSRIVDEAIKQEPKARFLFLTLTVKNVEGEALNSTISQLTKSFDRLFRRAKVKKNLLGIYVL